MDQIINYETQDPVKEIPKASVDLLIGTPFTTLSFFPVVKPKTGLILNFTSKSGDYIYL